MNQISAQPILHHATCPGASTTNPATHQMAYWAWGDPANARVLFCVHGLSRQGRDFDVLARQMSDRYYVICPDVVGRGESDWLADPKGYQVFSYVSDMVALVQHLRAQRGMSGPNEILELDWVGTSMGGLIGLAFSSLPAAVSGAKLGKFVLNDVGPRLRHEALTRIGEYLGVPRRFATQQEAADYLLSISPGFGPHTAQQWLALSLPMLRADESGDGWVLHYDSAIAEPFRSISAESAASGETALWQLYDALTCDVLLLRGQDSDLLDEETAHNMTQRGPKAKLVTFAGVGHAPTLIAADQVAVIDEFLRI